MDVNSLLHTALAACGGNQRELSRQSGVDKRTINLWLRSGTTPSLRSLVSLGGVCGLSPEVVVAEHLQAATSWDEGAQPLVAPGRKRVRSRPPAKPRSVPREKKPPERPPIPAALAVLPWFPAAWLQRIQAAKENGKKIGPTGERQQLQRLEKALKDPAYGEVAVRSLVEDATAGGWQGIKLEWYHPRRANLPASMEKHRAFLGRTDEVTDIDARARAAAWGEP